MVEKRRFWNMKTASKLENSKIFSNKRALTILYNFEYFLYVKETKLYEMNVLKRKRTNHGRSECPFCLSLFDADLLEVRVKDGKPKQRRLFTKNDLENQKKF